MCIICVEFQKGKLTFKEALQNANELSSEDSKHVKKMLAQSFQIDDVYDTIYETSDDAVTAIVLSNLRK